ncbi:NAD-dependent protein deacetylase sirtuin-7 [Rhinichthys klamathensis goyatoka]|uniref:NAD-dependent protein deacetylase sirtuin-7 n=1 Tax=Rhinichthys klamathensis goyatoka TaxID=3034132 RepID=UPI0024B608D1|nr:NAD-dependent protein deacetylase sirtuin-7 [Rhinichthys klamathensis goyatoka]
MSNMDAQTNSVGSARAERKEREKEKIIQREKQRHTVKTISQILQKSAGEQTQEERRLLQDHQDTVQELSRRQSRRRLLQSKLEEVFDEAESLQRKVKQLAEALQQAQHVVVYTGAGISTAASIPDYRGPNGVWTQLQRGRSVSTSDLSRAEPTLTHMCLWLLHKEKMVQHVVSQNCDGLHLRSGLPRHALSELHGNMFIEVCSSCCPARELIRVFDVTERTALHRHGTGRRCPHCGGELRDTIVHFGERGTLEQPLNWSGAAQAAQRADLILCLGSSLKVLKKYSCLWCMNRPANKRPKLYIVNLQWTPKDSLATLKIHGKCDAVMGLLMEELGLEVPVYNRSQDPIFSLAKALGPQEQESHSREEIAPPGALEEDPCDAQAQGQGPALQGGWFGRGYSKARRKRKTL